MYNALRKKLIELGLLNDNKRSIETYSWQNSHGSRLDVRKYINQQPYWLSTKNLEDEDVKRHIIINVPILSEMSNATRLWSYLLSLSFQLFVCLESGELQEIKLKKDVENFRDQMAYDSTSAVQDLLIAQGREVSDYYILDQAKHYQLFTELADFVSFNAQNTEQLQLDERFLNPRTVKQICLLNGEHRYKEITFTYNFSSATSSYYQFTWTNNFSADEFGAFIASLSACKDNELLFLKKEYCQHLTDLIVKDEDADVLDVSRFIHLERLIILKKITKIVGLEKLNALEFLDLGKSEVSALNLTSYKNLVNTTIHNRKCVTTELSLDVIRDSTALNLNEEDLDRLLSSLPSDCILSSVQELNLTLKNNASVDLRLFPNLLKLRLEGQSVLAITGLEQCLSLEDLFIRNTHVPIDVQHLKNLRRIHLNFYSNAKVIGLEHCTKLQYFHLDPCGVVRERFDGQYFPDLEHLYIMGRRFHHVVGLEHCKKLITLDLDGLSVNEEFDCSFPHLQELKLSGMKNLQFITGLDKCLDLRFVQIYLGYIQDPELKTTISKFPRSKFTEDMVVIYSGAHKFHTALFSKYLKLPQPSKPEQKKHRTIDAQTYVDPEDESDVERIFTPTKSDFKELKPEDYRLTIHDEIGVDQNNRILISTSTETGIPKYTIDRSVSSSTAPVYSAVVLLPQDSNSIIALPGLSANDKLISVSDEGQLIIGYSENKRQYFLGVKENLPTTPLCVKYQIAPDTNYEYSKGWELGILKRDKNLEPLPDKLRKAIEQCLHDPAYARQFAKILKAKKPLKQLHAIISYCLYGFKNQSLELKPEQSAENCSIDVFLEIIKQQKGSCRHRAYVFFILCRYFQLPVRMVTNQNHAYGEVRMTHEGVTCWKSVELGGSAAKEKLVANPAEEFYAMSQEETYTTRPSPSLSTQQEYRELKDENKFHEFTNTYANLFQKLAALDALQDQPQAYDLKALFIADKRWLERCENINDLAAGLLKTAKSPLLRIASPEHARGWHSVLYAYYHNKQLESIYVDTADEFKSLFEMTVINEGVEQTVDGPLKKLINRGNGVIIVNWSKFSANQRAIYKSIIDNPPSLNGYQFANNLRVIGLIPIRTEVNDVFLSRCDELEIPLHLSLPSDLRNKPEWLHSAVLPLDALALDKNILPVNLYHSAEWYKFLVDELNIRNDNFISMPGPLVQAMTSGLPIALINAPFTDEYFRRFWHTLTTEGRIYSNGKAIDIKPGFKVYLVNKAMEIQPPAIVIDDKKSSGKTYYFNQESFYQLFDTQHIDKADRIELKTEGWLEEAKEGDQFILQGNLMPEQWQRLYDRVNAITKKQAKTFHLYVENNSEKLNYLTMQCADSLKKIKKHATRNLHIESSDPHFTIASMQSELSVPSSNVFYLSNQDSWSFLIESIQLERRNGKVKAKRRDLEFWEKLKQGETVIISGHLSKSECRAYLTLFLDTPYLYVNGERHFPTGRFIWVGEHQPELSDLKIPGHCVKPQHEDYIKQLKVDYPLVTDREIAAISCLIELLKSVEPNGAVSYPTQAAFTYKKYQGIYEYTYHPKTKSRDRENPIKPILAYHYQKNSELYAFMNVMGKEILGSSEAAFIRNEKLDQYLSLIQSMEDFNKHFYRLLNCLSLEVIVKNLGHIEIDNSSKLAGIPQPIAAFKQQLLAFLARYSPSFNQLEWVPDSEPKSLIAATYLRQSLNRYDKQISNLISALRDPTIPLIYLLGETGTGKTYAARGIKQEFPSAKIYSGEEQILRCLQETRPDGMNIILLDEYNQYVNRKWELLRGLKQNPPVINYAGTIYPVSPDEVKVIIIGNPVYYPNRYFHQFSWDLAHVIWFAPFQLSFIQNKIRDYFKELKQKEEVVITNEDILQISEVMNKVYGFFREQTKFTGDLTLRDIGNVCIRSYLLKQQYPVTSWIECACQAMYDELEGSINHADKLQQFKQLLPELDSNLEKFSVSNLPTSPDLIIPPGKERIWRLILNDLLLRRIRIAQDTNYLGKLGTLLQGASGIGKSTIMVKILEHLGFSRHASDTQLRFYQITVGSEGVEPTLLKAFHEGSLVILDELNLDKDIKISLNQLLTGYDLEGNKADKPGFMVLSTQNPPKYAGCFISSREFDNRFHIINMGEYSLKDLEYIATTLKSPVAKRLTETYYQLRVGSERYNARSFFSAMHKTLPPGKVYDDIMDMEEGFGAGKYYV